jgi:hypothetical protein
MPKHRLTNEIPDNLFKSILDHAESVDKAPVGPVRGQVQTTKTIIKLLEFALDNWTASPPVNNDRLAILEAKIKSLEEKVIKMELSRNNSTLTDKLTINDNGTNVNTNDQNSRVSYITSNDVAALLASGFIEFSREEICNRFGWTLDNFKENSSNMRKMIKKSKETGKPTKYSGWVPLLDHGTYRYFFKK